MKRTGIFFAIAVLALATSCDKEKENGITFSNYEIQHTASISTIILPNAAYEILGTAEVHTMQTGETLNYLALKTLGTADLVNYIIFYNDPTILSNLSAGTKVKVPTLRRKSTGEIINKK